MIVFKKAELIKNIDKFRYRGRMRVHSKVKLSGLGELDCFSCETEFPVHFLPLLIGQTLSVVTLEAFLNYKKHPGSFNQAIDLTSFMPTRIVPINNQPASINEYLFKNLHSLGVSYQNIIPWAEQQLSSKYLGDKSSQFIETLERLYCPEILDLTKDHRVDDEMGENNDN